jgi:lysophospholipase L1-like esterase
VRVVSLLFASLAVLAACQATAPAKPEIAQTAAAPVAAPVQPAPAAQAALAPAPQAVAAAQPAAASGDPCTVAAGPPPARPAAAPGAAPGAPPSAGGPPAAAPGAAAARPALAALPPATEPRPRDDNRHKCFVQTAKAGGIDLLFVGDSITDWWRQDQRGKPEWDKTWAPLKAANFGIAGDTTQGVLWRMQNGELDGFKAKLIVLMLGTNNLRRNEIADIAAGDAAIVSEFRKRQPQAKVLVLGVFPRGAAPDNDFRPMIKELNGHLAKLADNKSVYYLDIGDKFLTADGTLTTDIMPDGLHPNLKGYGIWAAATEARVKELMK